MIELHYVSELLHNMRGHIKKIRDIEATGQLASVLEVGPNSFVQILQYKSLLPNQVEPVAWSYAQCWVNTMTDAEQDQIIGAYLNDRIGQNRIIGIYDVVRQNDTAKK